VEGNRSSSSPMACPGPTDGTAAGNCSPAASFGRQKPSVLLRRRALGKGMLIVGTAKTVTVVSRKESLEKQYEVMENVGFGSTSAVTRARRRSDGVEVALKRVLSGDEEKNRVARAEFDMLRSLRHPHIVQAYDHHFFGGHDVMSLEYFPGSTMEGAIRRWAGDCGGIEEKTACTLAVMIFDALAYLHAHDILHRDLNTKNVLISTDMDDLRLIDFNMAVNCNSPFLIDDPLSPGGSPIFSAPEVVLGQPWSKDSDVWSAGLCLFFMLSGRLPQRRGNGSESIPREALVRSASKRVEFSSKSWRHVSEDIKDILQTCLAVQSDERLSAKAVLDSPCIRRFRSATELGGGARRVITEQMPTETLSPDSSGSMVACAREDWIPPSFPTSA